MPKVKERPVAMRFPAGPRIREIREEKGISLDDVATVTLRTPAMVRLWEHGQCRPPRHVLGRICEYLDVDPATVELVAEEAS